MQANAVLFKQPDPGAAALVNVEPVTLTDPTATDVLVEVDSSAISSGTERLLYSGQMPAFPGLGYPLVPGYESVGRVIEAGADSGLSVGARVFVPGSTGYADGVRGLFGGSAERLVTAGARCTAVDALIDATGDDRPAVLLALAATAYHALDPKRHALPELIIGHGVLGRLMARITIALGGNPTVWESNPERRGEGNAYRVTDAEQDERRDYRTITDASGFQDVINGAVGRLAKGGEICLAGFYSQPLSFAFPPAFMKEARLRIAAEWSAEDMAAVTELVIAKRLDLTGLLTHSRRPFEADHAYHTAFSDPACLKMTIDWREANRG